MGFKALSNAADELDDEQDRVEDVHVSLPPRSLRLIRWANPADVSRVRDFLRSTGEVCPFYQYADLDGYVLLDEDPEIRGLVWFDLGKPETFIREIVVHPDHRGNGMIAKRLLLRAAEAARTYGSEGLTGFHPNDKPDVIEMTKRLGGIQRAGVRVRVPLSTATRFA